MKNMIITMAIVLLMSLLLKAQMDVNIGLIDAIAGR